MTPKENTVRETTVNLSTAELQLLAELLTKVVVPLSTAKTAYLLQEKITAALRSTNGT